MNFKKGVISTLLLLTTILGYGQNKMSQFLDSLSQITPVFFEKKEGFNAKANNLFKQIDTTKSSKKQVDIILAYYKHSSRKPKEYTYPLLQWSKKTAEKIAYKEGIIKSLISLGDVNRLGETSKDGFYYYGEVIKIHEASNNLEGVAEMISRLGLNFMSEKDYEASLKELFKALDIYKDLNNTKKIVASYHNIGDVFRCSNDTLNAIKYIKLSNLYEQKFPIASIKAMNEGFLGELYLKQNKLEIAKKHLEKSNTSIITKGVVPYLLSYNFQYLGDIEEANNNLNKAYSYYKKAFLNFYVDDNSSSFLLSSGANMANILIKQQRIKDAIELLDYIEGLTLVRPKTLWHERYLKFSKTLAQAHELNDNYKKANYYNKQHIASIKAVNSVNVLKNTAELEKKYQSKIDQQKIELLKGENAVKNRNIIISLLVLAGLVSVLILSYLYYIARSIALKRKAKLIEVALEIEKIKAVKLEDEKRITNLELELKQRELTTNSISLLQKKEQLAGMEKALKELKPLVNNDPKTAKILNNIISDCLASKTAYNWEEFKLTFENVHPKFYTTILKQHPNLSPNEKKLCAFLKLGLNSKDISAITQQSNRTIIIARSRLRKKLNLQKSDNLLNYVATF